MSKRDSMKHALDSMHTAVAYLKDAEEKAEAAGDKAMTDRIKKVDIEANQIRLDTAGLMNSHKG